MTNEEMKRWIDGATYEQLLSKWRFAPVGSHWFRNEIGDYYSKVMAEKRDALEKLPSASGGIGTVASDVSKLIGW